MYEPAPEDVRVFIDAQYAQSLINQTVEGIVMRLSDTLNQPDPFDEYASATHFKSKAEVRWIYMSIVLYIVINVFIIIIIISNQKQRYVE